MQDERQWLSSDHLIDKGVKLAGVAREAVAVWLGAGMDLVRVAQAPVPKLCQNSIYFEVP